MVAEDLQVGVRSEGRWHRAVRLVRVRPEPITSRSATGPGWAGRGRSTRVVEGSGHVALLVAAGTAPAHQDRPCARRRTAPWGRRPGRHRVRPTGHRAAAQRASGRTRQFNGAAGAAANRHSSPPSPTRARSTCSTDLKASAAARPRSAASPPTRAAPHPPVPPDGQYAVCGPARAVCPNCWRKYPWCRWPGYHPTPTPPP